MMYRDIRTLCQLVHQRILPRRVHSLGRISQKASTQSSNRTEPSNEPIQFFGSEASTWRAKNTRSGGADEMLWYQPLVISASLTVFLIYFCVLREENDIDRKLEGNLFDHVSGLEEVQLTVSYKFNKEKGLDTTALEARLKELGVDVKQLEEKTSNTKKG